MSEDNEPWWDKSKYDNYACIFCDKSIRLGDVVLDFMNPCCEMGGLSICEPCFLKSVNEYMDFKEIDDE